MEQRVHHKEVVVELPDAALEGILAIPDGAKAIVLFAHGSGSSRFSSRNRFVADELNRVGLATLLFDLLSEAEHIVDQRNGHLRFDIGLLTARLSGTVAWIDRQPEMRAMAIGLFGASTGAAAALACAAEFPDRIGAVVSRGGRPDLAGDTLQEVRAPTLLIVGGEDWPVIDLNREAAAYLKCEYDLVVVPGATHLFEEPGKLEEVARLARDWFRQHLLRDETTVVT